MFFELNYFNIVKLKNMKAQFLFYKSIIVSLKTKKKD